MKFRVSTLLKTEEVNVTRQIMTYTAWYFLPHRMKTTDDKVAMTCPKMPAKNGGEK